MRDERDEGKRVVEKLAAWSSRNVVRVCTQSSPSIGATALTAWAPRNPINKYYNGTPREVGAQHILLSPPPPTPPSLCRARPILSARRHIPPPASRASRRKKDLSYVALSQSLHSSYTRSPRPRPRPRNFVSHPVVRHPTNSPLVPSPPLPTRVPPPRARPATLSLSIRLFLILPKPATSHYPPLHGPSSPPPFTFYFSSSELKPRSCAARGRA